MSKRLRNMEATNEKIAVEGITMRVRIKPEVLIQYRKYLGESTVGRVNFSRWLNSKILGYKE